MEGVCLFYTHARTCSRLCIPINGALVLTSARSILCKRAPSSTSTKLHSTFYMQELS